ncbi:MAG: GAF domain-containing protein [Actinomycetota bacterium]
MIDGAHPSTRGTEPSELVSLADRMGYVHALRAGFVAVILGAGLLTGTAAGISVPELVVVAAIYLVSAAGAEAGRHALGGRAPGLVSAMLLADGIFIAWAVYATGANDSPLRFVIYLHIIAVSLLASHRTGLKIAAWHALLFFVVLYAQAAHVLAPAQTSLETDTPAFYRHSALNVVALLSVAGVTAVFSALNERGLRRGKGDLEILAEISREIAAQTNASAVGQIVLDNLCDSFGFRRGAVLAGPDGRVELLAHRGPGAPGGIRPGVDPIVEETWRSRRPALVKDLDAEGASRLASLMPLARNVVIAPLIAEGNPIGALTVEHSTRGPAKIERRVVAMVEQIAAQTAVTLAHLWLVERDLRPERAGR